MNHGKNEGGGQNQEDMNDRVNNFLSGCCSKTEVFEQL
jgi:hypothetical protein